MLRATLGPLLHVEKTTAAVGGRAAGVAAAVRAAQRQQRVAAVGPSATRHSGAQLEVLSLFRALLREVRRRTDPDTQRSLRAYIRGEFDRNASLPKRDVMRIEWLIHYGRSRLEDMQAQKASTRFGFVNTVSQHSSNNSGGQ